MFISFIYEIQSQIHTSHGAVSRPEIQQPQVIHRQWTSRDHQ
jgi:hypothetical protein